MEWREGSYLLTTDPAQIDVAAVHAWLTTSYWAEGIPLEVVRRSIENSLGFAVWWAPDGAEPGAAGTHQVGFARVISDFATFAYVGDVYVLEEHRGHGLSRWMMRAMTGHPRLQGLRRWCLLTRDAHGLYREYGFRELAKPDRWMEKWDPEAYR